MITRALVLPFRLAALALVSCAMLLSFGAFAVLMALDGGSRR